MPHCAPSCCRPGSAHAPHLIVETGARASEYAELVGAAVAPEPSPATASPTVEAMRPTLTAVVLITNPPCSAWWAYPVIISGVPAPGKRKHPFDCPKRTANGSNIPDLYESSHRGDKTEAL